jgi:capsular polysaccharide biosynthesis protein
MYPSLAGLLFGGARRAAVDRLVDASGRLRVELQGARQQAAALGARMEAARAETRELLKVCRRDLARRAELARIGDDVLLGGCVLVEGTAARRLAMRQLSVGEAIDTPFASWMGVTRCVTESPDVRELWEQLLETEGATSEGRLRCASSTVLAAGPAVVVRDRAGAVRLSLVEEAPRPAADVLAVPRFTCNLMPRKLRNFGHWLLDFVPQVLQLSTLSRDALFLIPEPVAGFQRRTLALIGIRDDQIRPWDGSPVSARRALVLLHDGRFGGGRPLSALAALQKRLQQDTAPAPRRRIFVSRLDAKRRRRWFTNQEAMESLFASRGFEVLAMSGCSLEEQVRMFGQAYVVAGISGAGLSDIVFSAPGTHVIVLHSESHLRWYADQSRPRATWRDDERARRGELAALGDSPRFYAHLAAALSQPCHSFLSADEAPIDELARFLDEVLERAEDPTCAA